MLTEEQVHEIWDPLRDKAKGFYRVGGDFQWRTDRDGNERPEFWVGYNKAIAERKRLEIHIVHGASPAELLKTRAPNAQDKEIEYMTKNFKQVTLTVFSDYENTLLRATNDNNFTFVVGDGTEDVQEKADEFMEYITTGIPEYGSVWGYVRGVLTRLKALDPMGLVVVMPEQLPLIESDGQFVIDPDEQLEPIPQYIEVSRVWGFRYDTWYLYQTYEHSVVMRGDKPERSGLVFHLVDDTWVWRISQTGQASDFVFDVEQWWEHGVGVPPCAHLMGTPVYEDGKLRYQSHYLPAGEHLDQVLLDTSYLSASKAKLVFPHMVVLDEPCAFMDPVTGVQCFNGNIEWQTDQGPKLKVCPSCKGSGSKPRVGPLGTVLVRSENTNVGDSGPNVSEALSFVGPPTDTLTFLRDDIEYNLTKGRSILHLHSEQPIVGGEQATATQVGVDVRASQAFIKPIADQTFFLAEFIMDCTGLERYGDQYVGITITRPTSYDVRTEQDLSRDFKDSKGMAPPITGALQWQYVTSRVGNEPEALMMMETIRAADTVFDNDPATVIQLLGQGVIETWQLTLHQMSAGIYDELARTGKLVSSEDRNADIEANAQAMRTKAKEMTPKPVAPAQDRLREVMTR